MMWHETHRVRMAAKTLARHRKAIAREPIINTALVMAHQMGRSDLVARLQGVRHG